MNRRNRNWLLAAITCLLAAAAFATPASAQAAGETMSGTLTDSNGDPVAGYCVHAMRLDPNSSLSLVPVQTNADGEWTLTGANRFTPGTWIVEFRLCQSDTSAANANLIPGWYGGASHIDDATRIAVAEGEQVTGIDAELAIGSRLGGRVVGLDGAPIRGCLNLYGPNVGAGITTGLSGQFEYTRLKAGDYVLRIDDCPLGSGLAAEWYEHGATRSQATTIHLDAGEALNLGDLQLSAPGAIEGTVTGPSGEPLEDICVTAYDADGERVDTTAYTDSSGHFTFAGLAPGDYRVGYADCNHYGNVAAEFFDDAESLETASAIAVTAGDTADASAQLAVGGSISGMVRGPDQRPLEDACVYLYDAEDYSFTSVYTDSAGRYRVGSLPSGEYRVGFDTCGAIDPADDIEEYWREGATLDEAEAVSVTSGSERSGVDATLGAPDPVAPETTITSGPAKGSDVRASAVAIGFGSSIPGSTFECSVDGGAYAPCASPRALTGLADGPHSFAVRATSPAGLVDPTPASRSFRVTACGSARAGLAAAEAAFARAAKRVKKARGAVAKAKEDGGAGKVARAKERLARAKAAKRSKRGDLAAARADAARACGV